MKVNEVITEQRIDEGLPALIIPAIISAVRVGGPKALNWLARRGAKGAAKGAGKVAKSAIKRPVTTALGATGIAGYNALKDIIPDIPEELKPFMIKYAIPAAAVLGVIYGGKKLYDYLKDEEKTVAQESIDVNLKNFLNETTSAGGVAAVAMPIGTIQKRMPAKKKKTKKKKR